MHPNDESFPRRDELAAVVERLAREARAYLAEVDGLPVLGRRADEAMRSFAGPLPETGSGAGAALEELVAAVRDAAAATSGPRCFHFVIGGTTPAALGADWLTALLDQVAYTWVTSPLGVELEVIALGWLKELFGLPAGLAGVMTTGATMANFVGLAAARQWWGERLGVDVSEMGLAGLPKTPVFTSGHVHASAVKVLSLLGLGRSAVTRLTADDTGRLDVGALERELRRLDGEPAILIANAGEVNAGDFDPIAAMADLAER